eukprot:scpid52787/ scgid15980/ 
MRTRKSDSCIESTGNAGKNGLMMMGRGMLGVIYEFRESPGKFADVSSIRSAAKVITGTASEDECASLNVPVSIGQRTMPEQTVEKEESARDHGEQGAAKQE